MVVPAILTVRPSPTWAPPIQTQRAVAPPMPPPLCFSTTFTSRLRTSGEGGVSSSPVVRHERPPRSLSVGAVAVDSDQLGSSEQAQEEKPRRYYFLVANAKFMLDEEEHFNELLYERRRNFAERSKELDFWLVIEPKFLDKFTNITQRLKRPAVALVSTDATWIKFMKLRLDRVLAGNFEADSQEEALAYNPVELQFEKPEKWTAPYPKYEFGWWEPFLPSKTSESTP